MNCARLADHQRYRPTRRRFAVIGSIAYLALRRWSPAAGVLAAAASLMIMAAGLDDCPRAPGRAGAR